MYGWTGKFLRVNLSRSKAAADRYGESFAKNFLGGRGFAVKILWDELEPKTDALSPDNKLILAAGPLTGWALPSSGKLVIAAKSPLTGGYGDGNVGSYAAVQMRKAGYDAVVIEGKAEKPMVLLIQDKSVDFLDGKDLWGLDTFVAEKEIEGSLWTCVWHLAYWSGWRKPRNLCEHCLPRRTCWRQAWNGRGYGIKEP